MVKERQDLVVVQVGQVRSVVEEQVADLQGWVQSVQQQQVQGPEEGN